MRPRLRPAAVLGAHDRGERFAPDPVAAALVADDVAPAAGARRVEIAVAPVHDRSRTGDDDDARLVPGARHQRDECVVDDDDARLVADAAHHRSHRPHLVVAVHAGDAQAHRGRRDGAVADRRLHHLMEHLLDVELAGRVEVRAAAASFRENGSAIVSEQTHGLGAARIDAEYIACPSILCYPCRMPNAAACRAARRRASIAAAAAAIMLPAPFAPVGLAHVARAAFLHDQ